MKRTFYCAGPMRGYPKFNFPAFDEARDLGIALGYKIISPADLDRNSGFSELSMPAAAEGESITKQFVKRDIDSLLSLSGENGDGIALLPGWEKSTGAVAEFFVARWLGLKVVNALTFGPFPKGFVDHVLRVHEITDCVRGYLKEQLQ